MNDCEYARKSHRAHRSVELAAVLVREGAAGAALVVVLGNDLASLALGLVLALDALAHGLQGTQGDSHRPHTNTRTILLSWPAAPV